MLIVAQKKHAMGKSMTGVVVLLQTNVKKEEATATRIMNANLALYVVVTIAESIIPQHRKLQIAAQQSYVMVKPQIGVVVHPVNSVDLEGEIVIRIVNASQV